MGKRLTRDRITALILAAAIVVVDQGIKAWLLGPMQLMERQVIGVLSFFDLRYATNPGISYGLFPAESLESRIVLFGVTGLIALGVLIWIFFEKARGDILALSLVLGGAVGNIIDRLRFTHVIDYADLHFGAWRPFAIFNFADVAITLGVILLLARTLFIRDKSADTGTPSKPANVSAGSATE